MDPLVSVILPVYNGEPFIGGTLDSALRQTYRNIEVIVVDDGSRDRTRAIVETRAIDDSRIHLISQTNRGLAATRNRALEHASGDFVAPLDADDLWDPTKIERQLRRAQEAGDDTGLVYCWWVRIDADGTVLDSSPRWRIEGDAADMLLHVNYIGNSSVPFFRRRCLEQAGGYDVTLREGCEDWDVTLKVAEQSCVAVVPSPLVGYRWHQNNMSGKTGAMWRSHYRVIDNAGRRRKLRPAVIRRSRTQFALYLAGVCFWSGAYFRALGWGLRAMRSRVAFRVLPYVIPLLWDRLWQSTPASRPIVRPGMPFASLEFPKSLIAYDLIYKSVERRLRAQ